MMLRGFWKLTWVEIKIFVREPMGVIGTVLIPVAMFLLLGRWLGGASRTAEGAPSWMASGLPIFASLFIAIGAVLSLTAILSIYREGGILKRLRATPLRPQTILGAHVVVKLVFTAITLALLLLAGKRFYPLPLEVDLLTFGVALLISTLSIVSIGFVIASIVPTARFAQPIGSIVLYPMLAVSGLFFPLDALPGPWLALARLLPTTYAVSLLQGVWAGGSLWGQWPDLVALAVNFVVCTSLAARVFRWE